MAEQRTGITYKPPVLTGVQGQVKARPKHTTYKDDRMATKSGIDYKILAPKYDGMFKTIDRMQWEIGKNLYEDGIVSNGARQRLAELIGRESKTPIFGTFSPVMWEHILNQKFVSMMLFSPVEAKGIQSHQDLTWWTIAIDVYGFIGDYCKHPFMRLDGGYDSFDTENVIRELQHRFGVDVVNRIMYP